jgi:transposase
VKGRKRQMLVDTLGLLLKVVVHPANRQDREGAKLVLAGLPRRFPRLRHRWAEQAYSGPLRDWIKQPVGWTVEIVERSPRRGFVVTADGQFQRVALPATVEPLPRRWGVDLRLDQSLPSHEQRLRASPCHERSAGLSHRHPSPPCSLDSRPDMTLLVHPLVPRATLAQLAYAVRY